MAQRHTTDIQQITYGQRETTIEIVRVHTTNLFEQLGRAPTLREIAAAAGRAPSCVNTALTELERRGEVTMRACGRVRRLASCAGVPNSDEARAVALAESLNRVVHAVPATHSALSHVRPKITVGVAISAHSHFEIMSVLAVAKCGAA